MVIRAALLLLILAWIQNAECTPEQPEMTFEQLYQFAKNEYTMGNWADCIAFFLRALDDFNYFVDENVWCREKCAKEHRNNRPTGTDAELDEIQEIAMMYGNAQHALCLFRCKNDRLTSMRPPLKQTTIFDEFQERKPYRYMQICYWQQKDLIAAVRSAYTYLVANSNDEETLNNLAFYMEQDGYNENMLVDALQMKYEGSYMLGVKAYNSGEWQQCVDEFESSMSNFLLEEEKCRRICEDKLNWETLDGANPEVSIIITSVYLSVLRCRNDCAKRLSRVNGHDLGSILPSYFEYLHVCYYKLGRGRNACQAVSNSILLNPKNPIMRRNRLFYSKTYEKDELFVPTEEIVKFHKRDAIEHLFLDFVHEKFKFENNELTPERVDDRRPLDLSVPINDDFDYAMIEREIVSPAECSTLSIAAVFETRSAEQKRKLIEITERIAERYQTRTVFSNLSCSQEVPVAADCKQHALIIAIDREICGTFFNEPQAHSCSLIYCVG